MYHLFQNMSVKTTPADIYKLAYRSHFQYVYPITTRSVRIIINLKIYGISTPSRRNKRKDNDVVYMEQAKEILKS